MITSTWFMVLAPGISEEMFETWYEHHVAVAKKIQNMTYYSLSRAFAQQPPQAHGNVFRIAQLSWDSVEKMRDAFVSYGGSAMRGDAILNMAPNPSIALTESTQFDVQRPAIFDTFRGRYRTPSGTVVKVFAFGMSNDEALGEWYATECAALGNDERVREHLFATSIKQTLKIGLLEGASLPSPGQPLWDWMLELWFDTKADAEAFLASPEFSHAWSQLAVRSSETHLSVHRTQDVLIAAAPIRHEEE